MATNANLNKQPIGWVRQQVAMTADTTLVDTDSGTTYFLNSAAGAIAITLPTTLTAGVNYKFVVTENTPTAAITIAAGSAIMFGHIYEAEVDTSSDGPGSSAATGISNLIIGTATEQGGWVLLETDGTSWYFHGGGAKDGSFTTS
jgi:hypothetical protein|tara:strand:+ start:891 stop:1325 length:435 start_codon:yes stop_codon:yes gene_type:complete